MKNLPRLLVLALAASLPFALHAQTAVTRYWPMNDGDIKYYSGAGGCSYVSFNQQGAQFSMDIYQSEPCDGDYSLEGSSVFEYSDKSGHLVQHGAGGLRHNVGFSSSLGD